MTSSEYRLPTLPLGRSEVTLVRWLKQPGERVAAEDPLLVVANDRLEVALPAGHAGVLERQHVAEGADANHGTLLATFAAAPQPESATPQILAAPPLRATPVARRVAADCGIALEHVAGTGVSARVTKADVLAARTPGVTDQPAVEERAPFAPLIPTTSFQQVPETHALSAFEVDLERVAAVCARLSADWARHGLACTEIVCVIAAVAAALPDHSLLNATWREEYIVLRRQIDLALLRDAGTVIVHSAQDLNLRGLARALKRPGESATDCSTFTIVEAHAPAWSMLPMLGLGQSATLGVGAAQERAVVVVEQGAERIAMRRIAVLSLAYDARMFDQAYADAFLRDLKARLEMFDA